MIFEVFTFYKNKYLFVVCLCVWSEVNVLFSPRPSFLIVLTIGINISNRNLNRANLNMEADR